MTDGSSFVFVFPYHGVGGVPALFLRLAERLARRGCRVSVVDYRDGAMGSACPANVSLISYEDDRPVQLPQDAVAVFQAMTPWSVFPSLRMAPGMRLFFWNCHPFNLIPALPGLRAPMQSRPALGRLLLRTVLRPYRQTMIRFTRVLLEREALVFMDRPNLRTTEQYLEIGIPQPRFLPIPAGDPVPHPARTPRDWKEQGLRLCWIGRIADFKVHILRRALSDLDALQPRLGIPIKFTVIGPGKYAAELRAEALRWSNLAVDFVERMPMLDIIPYLQEHIDVLFAMGTSALEGASAGIPPILLDVAYAPVPLGYRYSWLHEREGFTLGDVLTASKPVPPNTSLLDRLEGYMLDPAAAGDLALRYYRSTHAPDAVADCFVHYATQTSCYYRDFVTAGFARPDPVYELFATLRKRLVRT